jgi:hypothetical protein
MKRLVCGAAVVLSIFTAALLAAAQDEKTPTIKDVMKLHKGANAPLGKLGKALKSESPDWKDIQKSTKDFVVLGASLEKNDPPKGDKSSWKKFADGYLADAKALDEAAKAEDKSAAQKAHGKIAASCKACHVAHKGQ